MNAAAGVRARNLRTVGALAALFLLPLALAFYAYYASDWRPVGRLNHGTLLSPARPLPAVALPRAPGTDVAAGATLRGTWTLVYVGDGRCDADCRGALFVMRQTRLALNNDMTRVARVFLATGSCCTGEPGGADAGLALLDASGAAAAPLLAQFPSAGRAHSIYVVDPLGNLMMSYDARSDPHGLLEDLRKLLRLSHIG
jgi:cytochrome oxidase Cu insertion factor (SCO1/SenC/PrrC family)